MTQFHGKNLLYNISKSALWTLCTTPFLEEKWGLQGYTLIFLCWLKIVDCEYLLELPQIGGSHQHPQSVFWAKIMKASSIII